MEHVKAMFQNAVLDTIIPEATEAKLPEALQDNMEDTGEEDSAESTSLIPIKQRTRLFFDERLPVFVVLQIPQAAQDSLKDALSRLELKLEARVSNASQNEPQRGRREPTQSEGETTFSERIAHDHDPFIILNETEGSDGDVEPSILAIWELQVFLKRPRLRFPKPVVSFTASATLAPAERDEKVDPEDEYLPSLVPAPANLFERLKDVPALKDSPPYLPASRIESVLPGPQIEPETLHIQHQPAKPFPISPAVSARVRYTRINRNTPRPISIASLDFEVTPFSIFDVSLTKASLKFASDGQIEALGSLPLPMKCRPKDIVTFLYKVQPPREPAVAPIPLPSSAIPVGLLDVELISTLQISPTCHPEIKMSWRSTVDFSTPIDPRFGPSSQTLQRPNRPTSLPFSSSSATGAHSSRPPTPPSIPRPTSIPPATLAANTTTTTSSGLIISFTVPPVVHLFQIFPLTLLLTNQTSRPLKLALLPLPRRPPSSSLPPRKHAPKASISSTLDKRHSTLSNSSAYQAASARSIAPAVVDENIIYALQKAGVNSGDTDLVAVSTDVRVGPIGVGACHEVALKLLAVRAGVCRLEAVRVVDLGREREREKDGAAGGLNPVMDVRGDLLPEIVVVEAPGLVEPNKKEEGDVIGGRGKDGSRHGTGDGEEEAIEPITPIEKVKARIGEREKVKEKGKGKRRASKA